MYRARALYTAVYNDLKVWCEGCGDGAAQQSGPQNRPTFIRPLAGSNEGQYYTVAPNPNNGTMTLTQLTADNGDVNADVSDMLGRNIEHTILHFGEKTAQLKLRDVAPGIYVIRLTDSKGRIFTFKFVVKE